MSGLPASERSKMGMDVNDILAAAVKGPVRIVCNERKEREEEKSMILKRDKYDW